MVEVAELDERRRHGTDCECHRCRGMQPGNQLARRHGGYSLVGIDSEAAEIADQVRQVMPAYSPADESTLQIYAVTLARVKRATKAIAQVDENSDEHPVAAYLVADAPNYQRLREDLRGWIGLARRLANDLGLTPTSRAKLGLDLVRGASIRDDLLSRYSGTADVT